LIYIEVPCFDWICLHRSWFDVFYQHFNFRLADFDRVFGSASSQVGGLVVNISATMLKFPIVGSHARPKVVLFQCIINCQYRSRKRANIFAL